MKANEFEGRIHEEIVMDSQNEEESQEQGNEETHFGGGMGK